MLRYEIKDLTPPQEILHAMQKQITAEREKRALIAQSEGVKQQQINLASGQREAAIQSRREAGGDQPRDRRSTGDPAGQRNGRSGRNRRQVDRNRRGIEAVNLKVAERYIDAFGKIAKATRCCSSATLPCRRHGNEHRQGEQVVPTKTPAQPAFLFGPLPTRIRAPGPPAHRSAPGFRPSAPRDTAAGSDRARHSARQG
ncbi:SPFH domain-containing protein [Jeongeupia sp. USM3]|uniref:SPFH domain-containing protein n=1 Tax=Jeongeupia sp. USM3 TaxID=1906741 RepID=UPI0035B686A3